MKMNKWLVLLSIGFIANGFVVSDSNAGDVETAKAAFFRVINGAKKAIDNAGAAAAASSASDNPGQTKIAEIQKVNNSRYIVKQTLAADTQWAWIKITKDEFKEDVFLTVTKGNLAKNIFLRKGAGKYQIEIFSTNNPKQYEGSYYSINKFEITNLDARDLNFLLPSENVQSDDPRIIEIADKVVAGLDNDEEKVRAIHDFVANEISYDQEGLTSGSYLTDSTDAITVLEKKTSVCAGYANLFAAISRAAHIRTAVVNGNALVEKGYVLHAWNQVFVNNEWKTVDVTWDDMDVIRYDYFFPTAAEFAKDHQLGEVKNDF